MAVTIGGLVVASRLAAGAADVEAWVALGNVTLLLGDERRLEKSAIRLMSIAPHRFEGYYLMAVRKRQLGDTEGALVLLERAVDRASASSAPALLQGLIYDELGRPEEARRSLEKAVEVDPDNERARHVLEAISMRGG